MKTFVFAIALTTVVFLKTSRRASAGNACWNCKARLTDGYRTCPLCGAPQGCE